MKKILKNPLFMFVLGMLVMAGISFGVYALSANQIAYNNTTVKDALDDLYENTYDFDNVTSEFNVSQGTNIRRTASLNLSEGEYLVYANIDQGASRSDVVESTVQDYNINLNYDANNAECKVLSGKHIRSRATALFGSQYLENLMWHSAYLCTINTATTISVSNFQTGTYNVTTSSVFLDAIKIK